MRIITSKEFTQLLRGELKSDINYNSFYMPSNIGDYVQISEIEVSDELVLNQDFKYELNISINNCVFNKGVKIEKGVFNGNVSFNNTTVHSSYSIKGGAFKHYSYNKSCVFNDYHSISGASFENFSISSATFKNGCSIQKGYFEKFYLSGGTFENGLFFQGGTFQQLNIVGGNISELHVKDVDIARLGIYGLCEVRSCYIRSGIIKILVLQAAGLSELKIDNTYEQNNQGLQIDHIIFKQLGKVVANIGSGIYKHLDFTTCYINKEAIFQIDNIAFETLSLQKMVNYGQLNFSNVELTEKLVINQSDLGRSTFINCRIDKISWVFESSRITDVFFSNTTLPKAIGGDSHQQRSIYAQIKTVYGATGDVLASNNMYALEMNAYYNTLTWRDDFWEKLNIFLNKYSNDHGQNWEKAFAILIGSGIFFYGIFISTFPIYFANPFEWENFKYFLVCFGYFFEFINPIHKSEELLKGLNVSPNYLTPLIEGFSRIVFSYCIYQLVQAFRKHRKK